MVVSMYKLDPTLIRVPLNATLTNIKIDIPEEEYPVPEYRGVGVVGMEFINMLKKGGFLERCCEPVGMVSHTCIMYKNPDRGYYSFLNIIPWYRVIEEVASVIGATCFVFVEESLKE